MKVPVIAQYLYQIISIFTLKTEISTIFAFYGLNSLTDKSKINNSTEEQYWFATTGTQMNMEIVL